MDSHEPTGHAEIKSPGTFFEAVKLAAELTSDLKTTEIPVPMEEVCEAVKRRFQVNFPHCAGKSIWVSVHCRTQDPSAFGVKGMFVRCTEPENGNVKIDLYYSTNNLCWSRFLVTKEAAHAACDFKDGHFTEDILVLGQEVTSPGFWRIPQIDEELHSEVFAAIVAIEMLLPMRLWKSMIEQQSAGVDMRTIAESYRVPLHYVRMKLENQMYRSQIEEAYKRLGHS